MASKKPDAVPDAIPNPPGGGSWTWDADVWAWTSTDPAPQPAEPDAAHPAAQPTKE